MSQTNEVGKKIKEVRKKLKMSQSDLAARLGKTLRTVQKYESGEIDLSVPMVNEVADVLGISPAELIGYQKPEIRLDTMADVLHVINQLNRKAGLRFQIEVQRPPRSADWICSLSFHGNDASAPLNQDLCLSLERYSDEFDRLCTYWIDQEYFDHWFETELAYYAKLRLEDRAIEVLTEEERLVRRNALEAARIEEMKKAAADSDDPSS